MHIEAYEGFKNVLDLSGIDTTHDWLVLDVGGANVNGSVRDQLPNAVFHGLDLSPAPDVDIVADAARWSPEEPHYDVVMCTELFEHAEQWRKIIANMAKALDPKGPQLFLSTCASTGRPAHGSRGEWGVPAGQFYANVPAEELKAELEQYFERVTVIYNPNPGDAYAIAQRVIY